MSKLLNDSIVLKYLTKKKRIEVNDLSSGAFSVNKTMRFKLEN